MRDFKGMKRQRNRGRGGGGGGGGKPQHNANRAFDSNGPDNVKVRGAAQHIYEKYQQLARDAGSAGDRVLAENYLQHAEHYFRLLRAMQPQRPISEIIGRDQFASGYDIDFEDEGGQAAEEPAEAEAEGGQERQGERPWQRDERQRDDRQRDDRPREERGQGEYRQRDDRPRDDRPRDDRPRDDRPRDDRPRDDRPRDDREFRPRDDRGQGEYRPRDDRGQGGDYRPREDRPQGEVRQQQGDRFQGDRQGRYPRDDRRFQSERQGRDFRNERGERNDPRERAERDPLSVIEPQATPLTTAPAAPAPYEPREGERVLRGEDGAMSQAPAFLQAAPRADGDDEAAVETRRPRRRRAPRTFEAGDAPAAAEADEG